MRNFDLSQIETLDDVPRSHWVAIGNKLGGVGVVVAILRGKKSVKVEDAVKLLFDRHGRRIPEGLQANVCDANRSFRLDQPKLEAAVDYANRIMRLHGCLGVDTEVTAEQFKAETERLLALIRDNSQIANIAKGFWLPVVMPRLTTDDLGTGLEQYLRGVGKSYAETSERSFCNHHQGALAGAVSVVAGSRHERLVKRLKQGPVMGIHFPSPLQGFSVDASRKQMSTLPEGFILSGLDTSIAMAMYPDILARDFNTPGLDLAAFGWQSADYSLDFRAYDGELGFGSTGDLAGASGSYSGGLLFLG